MKTVGRPRPGAVGVCGSCGRSVIRAFIDRRGRHTATFVYGRTRAVCGGTVIRFVGVTDVTEPIVVRPKDKHRSRGRRR